MHPQQRLKAQLVAAVAQAKPNVPEAGRLLWQWFGDLHGTRTYGMNGPNPIGYLEIQAYAALMRWPLQSHHVALILAMDRAWIDHINAQASGGSAPSSGASAGPRQVLTPALFDAVFG